MRTISPVLAIMEREARSLAAVSQPSAAAELMEARKSVSLLVDASSAALRELQSCQAVIHLHGGFDPAYVEGAQKAMRDLSSALEGIK